MIITNKKRFDKLTDVIFKAQIILDNLKKAVKIGQRNIKALRVERENLIRRNSQSD